METIKNVKTLNILTIMGNLINPLYKE